MLRRVLRFSAVVLLMLMGMLPATGTPVSAQGLNVSCSNYDAWEWAQAQFETNPGLFDALDPDGDGIACPELYHGGFAPAFWTTKIPSGAKKVTFVRWVDADTLEVTQEGVSIKVRIYRADAPESTTSQECGGAQANDFAAWVLSFNDNPGTLYLEQDKTKTDRYGRTLAYVWFTIDGEPYMLNHILINNGWADDVDYGDRMYDKQLKDAAAFAKRHDLGVWDLCGGFGQPVSAAKETYSPPANSGNSGGGSGSGDSGGSSYQEPAAPVYTEPEPEPVYEEPEPEPSNDGGGCNPNYTGCVPNVSYDLNCPDIGYAVQVIGYDQYGLDRDGDGYGCESYG